MTSLLPSFAFSQSSLQDYADCPRRFELRFIEHLNYPAVEAEPALANERRRQAGEDFHRLTQQNLLGIPAEKVGRLANSADLERWWQNWLAFSAGQEFSSAALVAPELTLSAPLAGFRLLAKFDLLLVRAGRATIFDWKTTRKRPKSTDLAARMQTRVYRAVLAQAPAAGRAQAPAAGRAQAPAAGRAQAPAAGRAQFNSGQPFAPEAIEMIYWFADFPQEPARLAYSAAQYQRDWADLEQLIRLIAATPAGKFAMTDDEKKCQFCVYRSYCNRGARAGTSDWGAGDSDGQEFDSAPEIRLEDVEESPL